MNADRVGPNNVRIPISYHAITPKHIYGIVVRQYRRVNSSPSSSYVAAVVTIWPSIAIVWRWVGFPSSDKPSASIALCALAASVNSYFLNVYFIAYKVVRVASSESDKASLKTANCLTLAYK